jgi:AcrR family transcriptional regulator
LDALARDGLRAVAVEPLAERLGATKGSFYWHFRDRSALLEEAVAQWERTGTDELLEQLDSADVQGRQRAAAGHFAESPRDTQIFLVLLWNADHPTIGPVIHRILAKRMACSLRLRIAAGENPQEARLSMMYTYSVLLGLHMLRRAAPELVPECGTPESLHDFVAALVRQAAEAFVPAAV